MMTVKTQVCIIGAGSGGTGCAFRLIKNGIKTVVVDKNPDFGGTAVFGGVDGWEPGVSLDGIHQLLRCELEKMENACHVVEVMPNSNLFDPSIGRDWDTHSFEERPWGFSMPTGKKYEDTLARCTSLRGEDGPMIRFQFEPLCMIEAINNVLKPYKEHLTTFFNTRYASCKTKNSKIVSVTVSDDNGDTEILADYFVDASGDIILARDAGCDYTFGCESHEEYHEPCAHSKSDDVNAVTYVFRVSKTTDPNHIDKIPENVKDTDITDWANTSMKNTVSCFVLYPNGDININMLPTMQGKEYFDFGKRADKIGHARVYAYWNYLQKEKNLNGYTIKHIYDAGVREGYRLKGKYVLTEQDLRSGSPNFSESAQTIAIADHAMDVHGTDGMCNELENPYKIPLECSMPKEFSNLFVACRGASFSHIASSSVRLNRTMLSIGEGVGKHLAKLLSL